MATGTISLDQPSPALGGIVRNTLKKALVILIGSALAAILIALPVQAKHAQADACTAAGDTTSAHPLTYDFTTTTDGSSVVIEVQWTPKSGQGWAVQLTGTAETYGSATFTGTESDIVYTITDVEAGAWTASFTPQGSAKSVCMLVTAS